MANMTKVSSLSCRGGDGDDGVRVGLRRALRLIDRVAAEGADLVILPEIFAWAALPMARQCEFAEPLGGHVTSAMAEAARRHRVHILCPFLESSSARVTDSCVLFNRSGEAAGLYRKVYPTDCEMAAGVSPGPLAFEPLRADFGPVGCCICFDINFAEVIEGIAAGVPRLVVFPTMFEGLALMRAWAKLNRWYFVSAAAEPYSAAVDPLGRVIVRPHEHGEVFTVSINLDFEVLSTDYNKEKFGAVRERYGERVSIDVDDLESAALIVSNHPERSVGGMIDEFGLERERDYFARSRELAHERRGETP